MKIDEFLTKQITQVDDLLRQKNRAKDYSTFHTTLPRLDLSELLNYLCAEKIFYFKSKYEDSTFLALGRSKIVKSKDYEAFIQKNPKLYLIAAFLFEENAKQSEFILPEWLFRTSGENTEIIISAPEESENFSSCNLFFNNLLDPFAHDPDILSWSSYHEIPEHDQWITMIEECNQHFLKKELEKIVLSRKKIFTYDTPLDAVAVFQTLLAKNNQAKSSYAIYYQKSFEEIFISLTPEKLFSIKASLFESISLAASAPRGKTIKEDQYFEEMLTNNDKLIREHELVTKEIFKRLSSLVENIEISPIQTMKLPYIQHRSAPIKGSLKPSTSLIDLVNSLHPTPAVGGLPWDKAKNKIIELELVKRNHYAAPIGIVSSQYSELAVGIRSALLEINTLTLFAGAGIVEGSNPEEEWLETATKMHPFLKVVNHE